MPLTTDPRWVELIKSVKADNPGWGVGRIARKVRAEGERRGLSDPPHERTIGRILRREWNPLSEEQQAQYRAFYWPESMECGELPWEASTAALELLGMCLAQSVGLALSYGRPSIRVTKWFWHITTLAPDLPAPNLPIHDWQRKIGNVVSSLPGANLVSVSPGIYLTTRYQAARWLAAWEASGQLTPERLRGMEAFYAFAPWKGDLQLYLYCRAMESGLVPPIPCWSATDIMSAEFLTETLGALLPTAFSSEMRSKLGLEGETANG